MSDDRGVTSAVPPEATNPAPSTAVDSSHPRTPENNINLSVSQKAKTLFVSPYSSAPHSRFGSSICLTSPRHRYFHSRRVKPGSIEPLWNDRKDPMAKWSTIIPIIGILIGLGISGVLIWEGGLDPKIWTKEAEVGGYGNGQFEQTTITDENVYVEDGVLVIKPTLQDQTLIDTDSSLIDLVTDGTCSSKLWTNCIVGTNITNGTIVNPVKSGRINTKAGARIKYGRIEVVAKMPAGDWLWPAIWLLPVNNTYGDWPKSGEIDIAETRGNNHTYSQGGNNIINSAIHWGPNKDNDGWWRNNVKRAALHTTFSADFHTFGMEWSEKYLFTYVDNRLLQVSYIAFDQPLWERGQFPLSDDNGTRLINPWSATGRFSTPFDQEFYLILNVAVGGTNGWFQDGHSGKPWVDASPSARVDFWNSRHDWHRTWGNDARMLVKSVKIWQQRGYNGC